jgi:serine/threonine-protein kinase
MSTVHFAFDRVLQREVAIKRLTADYCSPVDIARFVAEAQITAQLDHPNIIPVYDLALGDEPFFVMKLLGGKNLAEHLAGDPIPRDAAALDRLLLILVQVCEAIEFAHGRGIVHRDLKPKNVVLDAHGRPYVMDWGLARILQSPDAANVSVTHAPDERDDGSGTAAYMAPEQSRPGWRAIGPWTDIFGIGTLLYEVLTGRPPHVADTIDDLRRLVARGEVAPPETHAPGAVPPALSRVVLVATAREPQHRHGSVEELRHEIEHCRRSL